MATKKWIQRAFSKNRGALHRMLKIPLNRKIPRSLLLAKYRAPGLLGRRVRAVVNANPTLRRLARRRGLIKSSRRRR